MASTKRDDLPTFLGGSGNTPKPPNVPVSAVPPRAPATDFGSGAPKRVKREGTPSPSYDENMAHAAEINRIHKAGLFPQREKKK